VVSTIFQPSDLSFAAALSVMSRFHFSDFQVISSGPNVV
jgi:hypothetical protein